MSRRMNARSDVALCSVSAKSCTHHAHCLRAQLPPHPARQVFCTPNRRGDECGLFVPIESISAASENLERSEQSGAESGDASGESGAAVHSPERAQQLHAAQIIFGKQS